MNAHTPPLSPTAEALLEQRDAIAEAHRKARLREDNPAAKALADEARKLTNEILRGRSA